MPTLIKGSLYRVKQKHNSGLNYVQFTTKNGIINLINHNSIICIFIGTEKETYYTGWYKFLYTNQVVSCDIMFHTIELIE